MANTIRPMQFNDLDTVAAIEQKNQYTPWTQQQFLESIEKDTAWVLYNDEAQLLGYIVFRIIIDEIELLNVSISSNCQRQGLGAQLLKTLINEAQSLRKNKIFLEVRRSNFSAIQLYENNGFKMVGIRKEYYLTRQGREDALVYGLDISIAVQDANLSFRAKREIS